MSVAVPGPAVNGDTSDDDRGDERRPGEALFDGLELADLSSDLVAFGVDPRRLGEALGRDPLGDADPEAVRTVLQSAARDGTDLAATGGELAVDGAGAAGEGAVAVAETLIDVAGDAEAALELLELLDV